MRALLAVLLALALAGCGQDRPAAPREDLDALRRQVALGPCPTGIGPDLPAVSLPCLGGGPDVRLDGPPSGVPTLVNVYGSWCGPCAEEMPLLAAFAKRASGKVALLGVDTQDEPRLALLFARDVGQTWPAVRDDDGLVLRRYGSGPPLMLFVDGKGTVVRVHRGAYRSVEQLVGDVRTHLGVVVA